MLKSEIKIFCKLELYLLSHFDLYTKQYTEHIFWNTLLAHKIIFLPPLFLL